MPKNFRIASRKQKPEQGSTRGLLNELLLGGRDAGDLGHLHLDILDGVATGDGERERGSVSFDEQLHTCVVAKTK